METVYVLWNYDIDEPIMASTDESLLEEFMCDIFMEDFEYGCAWESNIVAKDELTNEELINIVVDNWDGTMDFYNGYIGIVPVDFVH